MPEQTPLEQAQDLIRTELKSFVKRETLSDEIKSHIRAMSDRLIPPSPRGNIFDSDGNIVLDKNDATGSVIGTAKLPYSEIQQKAITTNISAPGASEVHLQPRADRRNTDPYRELVRIVDIGGAAANFSVLGDLSFNQEDVNNEARAKQGTVTADSAVIKTFTSQVNISEPAFQDIPGVQGVVVDAMYEAAQAAMAQETFNTLKAMVADAGVDKILRVKTGVANGLPNAANVWTKVVSLLDKLPGRHWPNATWVLSTALIARLLMSDTANGPRFSASDGIEKLAGYRVLPDPSMTRGTAANAVTALLGDFYHALTRFTREELYIEVAKYSANTVTVFGRIRWVDDVVFPQALVALSTAA